MKKEHVQLSKADREYLQKLISKGDLAVKIYRGALGLLELDQGQTYSAVAKTLGVNHNTVSKWAKKYKSERLQCLQDKPRSGRPIEIDGVQRAKVTEPPWPVATRRRGMAAGVCGCWQKRWLSWSTANICPIQKQAKF